ncbi:MAG: flagellar motor protein [Gammaproteobacteria bacterium]|nr:MAG: flagellar motor protein [Gammaproteobacteria bacterium]
MDLIAIAGAIIGFAAIIGGNMLEGGQLGALLNTPAGVIVIGGTLGAVILQTPFSRLRRSVRLLKWVLLPPQLELEANIDKITDWSRTARKEGLLGLENIMDNERDAFTKKGLALLIDAAEPHSIRRVLESELEARMNSDLAAAQVFRSMAGYSPTIGIIGAVLGLIQVMGNLADPNLLGPGIATAFVATIYGVGLANLLFLPVADRLRGLIVGVSNARAMTVEGLLAIAEGDHPKSIEVRLGGFLEVC